MLLTNIDTINMDLWNSFDPETQKIFVDATQLFAPGVKEFFTEILSERFQKMRDEGAEFVYLDPGESEKWQEAARPIWDKWIADLKEKGVDGQKLLDKYWELADKYYKG